MFNGVRLSAASTDGAEAATLGRVYDWAKQQSESLKIRREDIVQAKARARSSLGSALPRVTWNWMETWQEPDGVEDLERKGFSGFVEKKQIESKFSVKQPLFSGLREFSASSGFRRESARNALLLERAQRQLFQKSAEVFFDAVAYETDRANTKTAYELALDRVKELNGFLKLGKARHSEVYTAQAHAAALKGRLDQIEANVNSAREELSYLTGRDLSTITLTDDTLSVADIEPLHTYLEQAKERTDLRAQREDVLAKRLRVRYERGSYWPDADVTGNYYTKRATFLKDIDWDIVLSLEVPFYQGGAVAANVREAASALRQSVFTLEDLERYVSYSVRKMYGELAGAIQQEASLREASRAARQSYDALKKEYGLGLVTNLDVLQALDLLQEQQSAYDNARLKTKRLFVQLNVAVEKMP